MKHSGPFTDTDPRTMEVWLELLRGKTPGERILAALNLSNFAIRMTESGIRANYPAASDREIFLRAAALRLPRDLMISAYGWDPENAFAAMSTPAKALSRFLGVLDQMEIPYQVAGSVASSAHGIPRTTFDIGLVIDLPPDKIDDFAAELNQEFYADAALIRESFARGRAANVIHLGTALKFDLFPLQGDLYSRTEFARRAWREVRPEGGQPIECAVASAEDTVLRKLEWYRAGGENSERQWNDLPGVCRVASKLLDAQYLRQWANF